MAVEPTFIDLADMPEVADLIEQLLASGEARQLRRGDRVLGVLTPPAVNVATDIRVRHEMTPAEYAAFKAAAGSLAGLLDVDEMHANLAESRRLSVSKRRYH